MNYNELISALLPLILSALGVILAAFGTQIAKYVKKFFDSKDKRAIAEATVRYVEQVGKALGSEEKFAKAKETIVQQLNNEGIAFTDLELEVLIEAAVNGFKKEYAKTDEVKVEETPIPEGPEVTE